MSSKGAKGKGKGGFGAVRGGHSNHRSSPYTTAPHSQGGKESAICSAHGKKRSLECLKPCGNGDYECTPKHMCKQGSDGGNNGFMTTSTPRGKGGRKGAGGHDHLECSIHKKWRLKANLETDGWGGFCCSAGSECKTASGNSTAGTPRRHAPAGLPADGTGLCSAHNKPRSWSCLEEDGFGGWQCISPHQCKTKEGEYAGSQLPGGFEKGETGVCALHNKKRSMSALMETVAGLQCTDGMECKVGSRPTAGEADDMIMDNGLNPNEIYICSAHQKNRSSSVLIEDGEGGWVCRPEDECKGSKRAEPHDVNKPVRAPTVRAAGGTHSLCSVHEKMRSVTCMENDGMGGMCCTQEQQCKSKAPEM